MFTLNNIRYHKCNTNNKTDDENEVITSEIDFQYQISHRSEHFVLLLVGLILNIERKDIRINCRCTGRNPNECDY